MIEFTSANTPATSAAASTIGMSQPIKIVFDGTTELASGLAWPPTSLKVEKWASTSSVAAGSINSTIICPHSFFKR